MLNFRLASPQVLIDINRVPGLAGIEDRDNHVRIGAMTRQRAIETSPILSEFVPLLHQATAHIAHLPIRTRGTIGGSMSNADPAAEDPAVGAALDCTMICISKRGERRITAAAFFIDIMTTALESDEILIALEFPKTSKNNTGTAFEEISRRDGDFALAGIAAQLTLTDGITTDIRLAACGIGPASKRLSKAEASLLGECPDDANIKAAADAVANAADPHDDVHASANYRRQLAHAMTCRALNCAAARAQGLAA